MTEKRRDCATSGGTVWESRDLVKVSRLINPLDSALCREIASSTVEYSLSPRILIIVIFIRYKDLL